MGLRAVRGAGRTRPSCGQPSVVRLAMRRSGIRVQRQFPHVGGTLHSGLRLTRRLGSGNIVYRGKVDIELRPGNGRRPTTGNGQTAMFTSGKFRPAGISTAYPPVVMAVPAHPRQLTVSSPGHTTPVRSSRSRRQQRSTSGCRSARSTDVAAARIADAVPLPQPSAGSPRQGR